MIHLYLGTDREKARAKMNAAVEKAAKKSNVVRITDAHTAEDVRTALQGGGMFAEKRVLVFENVCTNDDLRDVFLRSLQRLSESEEAVFIFEAKPLAELRKRLEKHAQSVETYDAPKKEREAGVFAMANALRKSDKKALWVGYMREIGKGSAPEMVHGVLFWAAKDMLLKAVDTAARSRSASLVAALAALPHEARRTGEDFEYALERFLLTR